MRRFFGWRALTVLVGLGLAAGLTLSLGAFSAGADGQHGIGGSKSCSPSIVKIGDPMVCSASIRNNSDDFNDDMKTISFTDHVNAVHPPPDLNLIHNASLTITNPGVQG